MQRYTPIEYDNPADPPNPNAKLAILLNSVWAGYRITKVERVPAAPPNKAGWHAVYEDGL